MKVTPDKIMDKIIEYNLPLFADYKTEDQGYCFIVGNMMVFLDEVDDSLSVTFQADSKPEDVASNLLILCEIDDITDISVMESFVYDKDNNFISGKDAHLLVKETLIAEAFKKIAKHNAYAEILNNVECFHC